MKLMNTVRICLVKEMDYENARVRVKMGEFVTNRLLWVTCCAGVEKVGHHLTLMSTAMGMVGKGIRRISKTRDRCK